MQRTGATGTQQFQSTLPVGGATKSASMSAGASTISIHAPRGGSDEDEKAAAMFKREFQSTLPVGGATEVLLLAPRSPRFQSTLPVGGATTSSRSTTTRTEYFNPRSPWGERLVWATLCAGAPLNFNPRSPWGERLNNTMIMRTMCTFQSTLPVGGATTPFRLTHRKQIKFQSTLPVGGATEIGRYAGCRFIISIHAPRGGSDCDGGDAPPVQEDFNPRSPWGERPWKWCENP